MKRVLVARLDSMGDVLVSGPAVRAVAASAEVVLLAGPQGAGAARLLPGVAEVHVLAAPWIAPTDRPVDAALVAEVADLVETTGIEEAVVLTSFHQSPLPLALLLRLAGVQRITGASVDAGGGLLDARLIPGEDFPEDLPEPLRALRIAAAAGFALPDGDDRLAVTLPAARPDAAGDGPYVVVHPGAAVPARAYPAAHCARVVELLAERGHRVLVTGGPDERALTAAVAGTAGTDLGGALGLAELGAVLRDADVVVVGNTGPAHLAAAAGTAIVSLFAPVVPPVRWAPWGVPVALLGDQEAPCRGSRARVCPVAGHPCLASVIPETVADAAERLIADRLTGALA
ncbi:glycosyltransferase family 9 protein [Amnibacterium soli]|uniref:Glycosyltransferase family 9 protein n=1 Tax=Amnibacterium soli TaxID=1282736 RepID=A0ABP8YT49_9MICO